MAREGREAVDKIRGRGDPARYEEEGYQSADRNEGYGSDLHDSGKGYPEEQLDEKGGGSSGFNWLRMQMGL
jgi:hypothetical protein